MLSTKINPGTDGLSKKIYQFQRIVNIIDSKLFSKIETKETLPKYFYEVTITLKWKSMKM